MEVITEACEGGRRKMDRKNIQRKDGKVSKQGKVFEGIF
jgi:hypothetical protein